MLYLVVFLWQNAKYVAVITNDKKAFPGMVFSVKVANLSEMNREKAYTEAKKEARNRGLGHVSYLDD